MEWLRSQGNHPARGTHPNSLCRFPSAQAHCGWCPGVLKFAGRSPTTCRYGLMPCRLLLFHVAAPTKVRRRAAAERQRRHRLMPPFSSAVEVFGQKNGKVPLMWSVLPYWNEPYHPRPAATGRACEPGGAACCCWEWLRKQRDHPAHNDAPAPSPAGTGRESGRRAVWRGSSSSRASRASSPVPRAGWISTLLLEWLRWHWNHPAKDSFCLSRVDQHVVNGMATVAVAATRLEDSPSDPSSPSGSCARPRWPPPATAPPPVRSRVSLPP